MQLTKPPYIAKASWKECLVAAFFGAIMVYFGAGMLPKILDDIANGSLTKKTQIVFTRQEPLKFYYNCALRILLTGSILTTGVVTCIASFILTINNLTTNQLLFKTGSTKKALLVLSKTMCIFGIGTLIAGDLGLLLNLAATFHGVKPYL